MLEKLIQLKEYLEHLHFNTVKEIAENEKHLILISEMIEELKPQKPAENLYWCDLSNEQRKISYQWYCGICSREVDENMNYCSDCGTKINWWEEEE